MKLDVQRQAIKQGYSIRKLAQETELAYTTVLRYWHSYIQRPSPDVLKKIATVLHIDDWRTLILDNE